MKFNADFLIEKNIMSAAAESLNPSESKEGGSVGVGPSEKKALHLDPHVFIYSKKTPLQQAKVAKSIQSDEERKCLEELESYIVTEEFSKDVLSKLRVPTTNLSSLIIHDLSNMAEDRVDDYGLVLDAFALIRFCAARKFELEKVKQLVSEMVAHRLDEKPHLIQKHQVMGEIKKEKGYWLGRCKSNCPIIYVNPQNHMLHERVFEETVQYTLYMAEVGVSLIETYNREHVLPRLATESPEKVLESYVEHFSIVYDGRLIAMKNFDLAIVKEFLRLANFYPERMKYIVVYKPNWSYRILFKMVSPFIDKKTADKIRMTYEMQEVEDVFHLDKVPEEFGGKRPFKFDPEKAPENKPFHL